MNPKTATQNMKTEIKYLLSGATSDEVEIEESTAGRKTKNYDFNAVVEALKNGKKYVLPTTVKTTNTMYTIKAKLAKIQGLEKVEFAIIKGTTGTATAKKSGNPFKTAQFVVFIPKTQ